MIGDYLRQSAPLRRHVVGRTGVWSAADHCGSVAAAVVNEKPPSFVSAFCPVIDRTRKKYVVPGERPVIV
jgi:hypothetical protein